MATDSAKYGGLPFAEAIAYFRDKLNMPTARWTDLWQEMHGRAFTIAGALQEDLLQDLREAVDRAIAEGTTLASSPQDIWRLPRVEEAVRSMARHGENSGGVWDADAGQASYETRPDKESPLWNVHSQVIYWWTATEIDAEKATIIAYDGEVWPRSKDFGPAYLGYRCVKSQP